jgi:hypothetical protein
MCTDHGKLLRNTIRWALNEEPITEVKGPGVVDVTVWRQETSMTVHLVNLTNPMMMKGPFRELLPVSARVSINIPQDKKAGDVRLLVSGKKSDIRMSDGKVMITVPQILDHEIIAIDLI